MRDGEVRVSEGQTGIQGSSEEQSNHKEVERPEYQRKDKAKELPVMCMSHQKWHLTVHDQHCWKVY